MAEQSLKSRQDKLVSPPFILLQLAVDISQRKQHIVGGRNEIKYFFKPSNNAIYKNVKAQPKKLEGVAPSVKDPTCAYSTPFQDT